MDVVDVAEGALVVVVAVAAMVLVVGTGRVVVVVAAVVVVLLIVVVGASGVGIVGIVGVTTGNGRGFGRGRPSNSARTASRMNAALAPVAARVRCTESTYDAPSVALGVSAQSAR